MTILVAADFDADEWALWQPLLAAALPHDTLVREADAKVAAPIEIALVANPAPGSLAGLPNLRLIQSLWAGVDRLLADPTVPAGVPLARMVDPAMNETLAETALWAALGVQRDFFGYARQQREHRWQPQPLRRAGELTVAVLGLGEMGRAAARALAGRGHRVLGWSRASAPALDGVACHAGAAALPAVLGAAGLVIDLLPLTPETRGLFDARAFAAMAPGATFTNLARGAHVVEADLLAALDRGHLAHAVLDVFETEPLPPAHPFWSHPRITLLPHVAAQTDPRSAAAIAAENVRALREGRALRFLVDRGRGY